MTTVADSRARKSLKGRIAVITGGARGIGLCIARAFAREGAHLLLAARSSEELGRASSEIEREFKVRCISGKADVARVDEVHQIVEVAKREFGRVDILINNAGVYGPIGEFVESNLDDWRQAIEINLMGTVYATHAVLPIMRRQRDGCIINLAGAGVGGPFVTPRITAYATSKAAIVQFTESVAREVSGDNVRVNAIAPGAVTTAFTHAVIAAGPERAGREFYETNLRQTQTEGHSPEPAARLAVLLATGGTGALTGKLLSAKWDTFEQLNAENANRTSLYSLRRIDEQLFHEVPRP